jgi:2-amino-4-hydroxy-6-hydroxymethyldihydropteridine diphosphokinase
VSARPRYWLGLGSNVGDRFGALAAALGCLERHGLVLEAVSPVYETAPREMENQPSFLNAACRVRAALDPPGLLAVAKACEAALGRTPGPRFGPRRIDCDILLWEGGTWRDADLEVPHPRLAERRFALVPLLAIDPGLALPDGRTLAELEAGLDPFEQPVALAAGPPRPGAIN